MKEIVFRRRRADRVLFALVLVLAIAAYAYTFTFDPPVLRGYPGAALFPQLIALALAVFCVSGLWRGHLVARAVRRGAPAPPAFDDEIRLDVGGLAVTVVCLAAFMVLLAFVGMEPAIFVFLAGMLYLRTRRPVLALVSGLAGTVVGYFLFVQFLAVHLPLLFLPRYLGWW